MDEDELLATCLLLFFAGHETTVNLIGNGRLALLQRPDQLEQLCAGGISLSASVDELVHFDSPVQR